MDLFATLSVRHSDDQRAIEHIRTLRDKRWLASLGPLPSQDASGLEEAQADPNVEMAALEETFEGMALTSRVADDRPVRLTMNLIRQSLSSSVSTKALRRTRTRQEDDEEVDAMLRKRTLRLDWLDIKHIDNLDAFTHVEELYLQYNLIETIEKLDDLQHLAFLALAGNRIRHVQNLKHLPHLKFLDLSMNYIEEVDVSELPASLCILRLAGNPLTKHVPAYASLFFKRLPHLVQIDQFRRPVALNATNSALSLTSRERVGRNMEGLPLLISPAPVDQFCALHAEVDAIHSELNRVEKQERSSDVEYPVALNCADFAKQHQERMAKWQLELTMRTSRMRQQVAESDASFQNEISASFQDQRSLALTRVRLATDSALLAASSHVKQMEEAYQDWHQSQRRPIFSEVT